MVDRRNTLPLPRGPTPAPLFLNWMFLVTEVRLRPGEESRVQRGSRCWRCCEYRLDADWLQNSSADRQRVAVVHRTEADHENSPALPVATTPRSSKRKSAQLVSSRIRKQL